MSSARNAPARTGGSADRRTPGLPAPWRWRALLAAGVVLIVGAAAYSNSLRGEFVFDDAPGIVENPTIRRLWAIGTVLSPPGWMSVGGRPIVNLSLAINYASGGLDVLGYHVLNLAIHLLAGATLLGVVRRTLLTPPLRDRFGRASTPLALVVALIWTVHPLQTESVTYIIQRAESLMGLFYLLTLYCLTRAAGAARRWPWHVAGVLACGLGMGSKEVMVSAPVVALLYDRLLLSSSFKEVFRRRRALYAGLAATWVLLGGLVASTGGRGETAGFGHSSTAWTDYARTQFGVVLHYLRLSVVPHPLCLDYGWPVAWTVEEILPGAIVVGVLLAATVFALARRSPWAVVGAWFFAILAPTSSIMPLDDLAFEHRMYLPLGAVATGAVVGGYWLGRALLARLLSEQDRALWGWAIAAAAALGVAATFAVLTYLRNNDYRSAVALWDLTVRQRPENWRAHSSLAVSLMEARDFTRAMEHYNKAVGLKPDYADGYSNRGTAYDRMGQYDLAIADFNRALELRRDPRFYYNRGKAHQKKGRPDQAIEDYTRALGMQPAFARAYNDRGVCYNALKRHDRAIADFDKAVALSPEWADAYCNRGNAWQATKQYDRAIADYTRAIELNADLAGAYNNRAIVYCIIQAYDNAWADVRMLRRLGVEPRPELLKVLREASGRNEP